ncbi:LytR/AlgR family response regulator transcription factor [Sunxiuqinia elliptica]|uniref:Two component transcriptional regulator, LytTR family n=1 Tax=Sunxiuqinia elliptica TaxID=655355 RepID=A0A1I2CYI5_9BACT|nr:response regulator transcription factor [Sunxiuqinia elliptica]SFE72800.1 two component transcriptional regulator, LytTR family [Sunxiuqinia elliptica]
MEKKVRCLIVDDEPLAIEVLKAHISKLDSIEIAGTASDAVEAFDFLNKNRVDLMFLDINMPEMKGTELVKSLKHPPQVIFTTAYREYAIEGYELNVVDYLLKPISFLRFMQAVEKFFFVYNNSNGDDDAVSIHRRNNSEEFLYMREKNMIHKIPVSDVIYVESMGDNLTIYTDDRTVTCRCTISSVQKLLSEADFVRIHRSFIVAIKEITSFSPVSIFIGKKEFSIGSSYRSNVLEVLDYKGFLNK